MVLSLCISFYYAPKKNSIKVMMYDGTRRQQHCTTLFHVIGFYAPII